MPKLLIAGGTGALGRELVALAPQHGHQVRCLARGNAKFRQGVETHQGDLTKPETLTGCCHGVDTIISCAGASMKLGVMRDKTGFYEVDFQGNSHLLAEAERSGVRRFVYVSLHGGQNLRATVYADAHERFVDVLQRSPLETVVVRPTGFFHFLHAIWDQAKRGRGITIGKGTARTNPVHQRDVAAACLDAISTADRELPVGGPEVFTRDEVVELALRVARKKPKVRHVPAGLMRVMVAPLKKFNPRLHALMDFGIAVSLTESVAASYGKRRLEPYFEALRETQ